MTWLQSMTVWMMVAVAIRLLPRLGLRLERLFVVRRSWLLAGHRQICQHSLLRLPALQPMRRAAKQVWTLRWLQIGAGHATSLAEICLAGNCMVVARPARPLESLAYSPRRVLCKTTCPCGSATDTGQRSILDRVCQRLRVRLIDDSQTKL